MARRICVVTGSRADYGHLYWLLRLFRDDPAITLQLVVCGMHLAPRYDSTWRVIEDDGFIIDARVESLPPDDSRVETAKAVGRGVIGMAEALADLRPDIVTLLGDRFEILAAGQAAMFLGIPIAHIHGGELSEGAIDDAIRHSLTKMAHLHFVAAEPYARRVVQMGESPDRVFTVGAPGLDHLEHIEYLDRTELAKDLGLDLTRGFLLITYHPVTLQQEVDGTGITALLEALGEFEDRSILFTGVNSDPQNYDIDRAISEFVIAHPTRTKGVKSLGQRRYLSVMRVASAVIGNSSSGLIEAPALGVPTVNTGPRQSGRLRASSVIDCAEDAAEIAAAIRRAVSPEFRTQAANTTPPYGRSGASHRIVEILKAVSLEGLNLKKFHDLP